MFGITSLDNLKLALKFMPLDKEIKESLLENSKIIIEFRNFLADKYKISNKKAEDKIKESTIDKFNLNDIDKAVDVAYEYCQSEGFNKSEEVKIAIQNLLKLKGKFIK